MQQQQCFLFPKKHIWETQITWNQKLYTASPLKGSKVLTNTKVAHIYLNIQLLA